MQHAREGLALDQVLECPKIFVSCVGSAGSRELLRQHGIRAVLSLVPQPFESVTFKESPANELERYQVATTTCGAFQDLSIERYLIRLKDSGDNSPEQLQAAFHLLQEICKAYEGHPILVHCQGGMSRSVSLVAALIAKSQRWSFQEGVQEVGRHHYLGITEAFAESLTRPIGIPFDRF